MIKILAGTSNKHKVQEFRSAFKAFEEKISLLKLDEVAPFEMPEENGSTFEENACIKADGVSAAASMLAFADDSGLEVECLNNAPGIYSARYAGENATDADRIAKLLSEMKKTGSANRKARFVCAMALSCKGKTLKVFRGEVSGVISEAPSGTHGFGYDPVFIPDGYDVSFGELPAEVKDSISHRAKALGLLAEFLREQCSKEDFFDFA
ncbi:MAG: RdgB/HAM1 family non-canonical purine NTP pyrophosphatase [Lentisphaeria bacterium]|nr:RdgB/HAM1 family non-canonical purine NTP pyrophosphatase [Lentisphaeria bacterium]